MYIDSRYLKYIVICVLVSFIMLILQPTAQALQLDAETLDESGTPVVDTADTATPSTDLLRSLTTQLQDLQSTSSSLRSGFQPIDITPLQTTLTEYDTEARTGFAITADLLEAAELPPEILVRQQQAEQTYEQEYQTVATHLTAIADATTAAEQAAQIDATLEHLNPLLSNGHIPFNPDEMAFGSPRGDSRAPLADSALRALNPGGLRSGDRDAAPDASALAPTPDVQITADIQALAASLDYNPIAIYNWVHDNIHYIPTYGSVQGSQLTLDNRAGNAFDTASLLIALLRASGIHSRYAYGTVRIPIDKVMNWVGGMTEASDAIDIISLGYIPATSLTQGGVIKQVKMEHVWVEAWLDYYPSRGVEHQTGDSWVPLDASFKQYEFIEGLQPEQDVPFPTDTLVTDLLNSATLNSTDGTVTGMDEQLVEDVIETYEADLQAWFDVHKPDATVADMLDTANIIPLNRPYLTMSLPYQLHEYGSAFNALPDNLRHRLTISLYNSTNARALDNPTVTQTLGFAELGILRLNLTYEPATQADVDALAHFREELATDGIPAYLFDIKPVLKLEDTVLGTGQAMTMGDTQYYRFTITDPHNTYTHNGQVVAGTEVAFVSNGNGLSPEAVDKRMATVSWYSPEENLHLLGLHFWMEHDFFDHLAAQAYGVKVQRMPSIGAFTSPLSVTRQFGIPQTGEYKAYQVDVRRNVQTVWSRTDEDRFQFMSHIGINGSYIEGSVIEQLFDYEQGRGLSTTQVLLDANAQNIPIVHVTAANYGEWASKLSVSADVRSDIVTAIQTGKEVIIPQRAVQHGDWLGSGYIIQDPVTGEGVYLIEGGANGGFLELFGCEFSNFPLMQTIILEVVAALMFYAFMPAITASAAGMGLSSAMAAASTFTRLVRPIMRAITKMKQFRKAKNKRRAQCKGTTRSGSAKPKSCKRDKDKCGADFELLSVSFANDLKIYKDGVGRASEILDPVWNNTGKNDAVGYVSGKKVKIKAKFKLTKPPKNRANVVFHAKAFIRGKNHSDAKPPIFPEMKMEKEEELTPNPRQAPTPIEISWTTAENKLTDNLTQFFDPLEIRWFATVTEKNKKDKQPAQPKKFNFGVSDHQMYVTFQQYNSGLYQLYLSNLHWAVSKSGAKTSKEVVKNTWQHFTANKLTGWDGNKKFYYYRAGGYTGEDASANCLMSYALHTDCVNFSDLFMDSLAVNGIGHESRPVEVQSRKPTEKMLIKNWEPIPSTSTVPPNAEGYKWLLSLYTNSGTNASDKFSMVPKQGSSATDSIYGDLRNLSGVAGQNMSTPIEKVFSTHTILKLSDSIVPDSMGNYFDPSYGQNYSSEQDFEEKAVFGYAIKSQRSGNRIIYQVRQAPLNNIKFELSIQEYWE